MYSGFNIPLNFKGACTKREHDGSTLYNSYYQWVSLFLVVSALLFYTPRYNIYEILYYRVLELLVSRHAVREWYPGIPEPFSGTSTRGVIPGYPVSYI